MSDLFEYALGFKRLLATIAGLGLLLLVLLALVVEGRTATVAIYLVISGVLLLAGIAIVYLRVLSKESSEIRQPPEEWERREPEE
ncbi:hypothetical protein [Haloarchaeobius iranensis]|uniref:Uncharacterized protein n=1 Tax=Haloarchaeobius iranensis TaxID=996166 RepID=A0A1G9V3H2_9EURY|nr:hypothetical protein [Haloarchaeobius iranensis]SDM66689.1 hypothetical protein SAMN05192554_105170 [Haloarchaeobius iranensis]